MTLLHSPAGAHINRRQFLSSGAYAAAGLVVYSGMIARHWLQLSHYDVRLRGLAPEFDGFRIAQLSDIHFDEFTEPWFLREAIRQINAANPDAIFLTGDYVTHGVMPRKFALDAAWQCAGILRELTCRTIYAVLGNHDNLVGAGEVAAALSASGITVLSNAHLSLQRGGARIWLAGLEDPLSCIPRPDIVIPAAIRNVPHEPVILLCHAPDVADTLLAQPAGQAVALMLSGHTHGGQVRLPLLPPIHLPELGRKYVQGWFQLGSLQLHVNRGLGTVGVPFRLNCAPQISLHTLRA